MNTISASKSSSSCTGICSVMCAIVRHRLSTRATLMMLVGFVAVVHRRGVERAGGLRDVLEHLGVDGLGRDQLPEPERPGGVADDFRVEPGRHRRGARGGVERLAAVGRAGHVAGGEVDERLAAAAGDAGDARADPALRRVPVAAEQPHIRGARFHLAVRGGLHLRLLRVERTEHRVVLQQGFRAVLRDQGRAQLRERLVRLEARGVRIVVRDLRGGRGGFDAGGKRLQCGHAVTVERDHEPEERSVPSERWSVPCERYAGRDGGFRPAMRVLRGRVSPARARCSARPRVGAARTAGVESVCRRTRSRGVVSAAGCR